MMLKPLLAWRSPAGAQARLTVLIFHRVMALPDPLFPGEMHARRFAQVCGWLKAWFNVLPLDVAVSHLKAGTLPARAACITFDDGYADNYHIALPILQRSGLSATFFIATGFLDGGRMWNDTVVEALRAFDGAVLDLTALGLGRHATDGLDQKRSAIDNLIRQLKYQPLADRVAVTEQIVAMARVKPPHGLMMTSPEVAALHQAGQQIGAHTVSHPILAQLVPEAAHQEIEGSKLYLEQLLGERISVFAYPNGKPGEDYSPSNVELVRRLGFDAAVSTQWGSTGRGDDLFQMRRFTPWDASRWRFGSRLIGNLRNN